MGFTRISRSKLWVFYGVYCAALLFGSCRVLNPQDESQLAEFETEPPDGSRELSDGQGLVTIIGTNDLHGSVEETFSRGGAYHFSGYVEAIRKVSDRNYGENGTVLLLDAGDSFQGTLLSNYSEGQVVAEIMKELKYTAVIPGNHGFDFGPLGWKVDTCRGVRGACDPLGALKKVVEVSGIPWLSVNTYRKNTDPPEVVEFLKPYHLVPFQGRYIAIIGMEDVRTAAATVAENVEELRFGGFGSMQGQIEQLWNAGEADIFIVVYHGGDGNGAPNLKRQLDQLYPADFSGPKPDFIVAGHTHIFNQEQSLAGIPYIQSYANGQYFGLGELVIEKNADGRLAVVQGATRVQAGIRINGRDRRFWGQNLRYTKSRAVEDIVERGRRNIAEMASKRLTKVRGTITQAGGRESDTDMGKLLTTAMLERTGAQAAILNNGHIRKNFSRSNLARGGEMEFEHLFNVIPNSNKLMVFEEMPVDLLAKNFMRAVRSCGVRGVLEVSGLKVEYSKRPDCDGKKEDLETKLLRLVLDDGTVIWEDTRENGQPGQQLNRSRSCQRQERDCPECVKVPTIKLATIDFLWTGGAGYCHFEDVPYEGQELDLRDEIAEWLSTMEEIREEDFVAGAYVNRASL